jgi:diacylglycerol kinase (ATP)
MVKIHPNLSGLFYRQEAPQLKDTILKLLWHFFLIMDFKRFCMRILFVMNPTSGRKGNDDAIISIEEASINEGFEYKLHLTTGKDDDALLQEAFRSWGPDRVAACGGDGTVQLVARNLLNTEIPLGIMPLGSANGLAKALSIPRDHAEATNVIVKSGHIRPLDLIRINDEYLCTHLSDIGTNALLVKNYEEAGDKGMIGYAKHLFSSIQQSDLMQYVIDTPEGSFRKEGYMLMIANAHKYGTGVQISEGSVSDGMFEICNVQTIDLESAIKAGLTAMNIFIDKDMFSDVISCREALIRIKPQAHLQIDGEYIGEVNDLKVNIISSAIKVIVPG